MNFIRFKQQFRVLVLVSGWWEWLVVITIKYKICPTSQVMDFFSRRVTAQQQPDLLKLFTRSSC